MIKSLVSLTAAMAICLLLVACGSSHPEDASHDKGPRPPPSTPQEAPGPGQGADQQVTGSPPTMSGPEAAAAGRPSTGRADATAPRSN